MPKVVVLEIFWDGTGDHAARRVVRRSRRTKEWAICLGNPSGNIQVHVQENLDYLPISLLLRWNEGDRRQDVGVDEKWKKTVALLPKMSVRRQYLVCPLLLYSQYVFFLIYFLVLLPSCGTLSNRYGEDAFWSNRNTSHVYSKWGGAFTFVVLFLLP